MNIFAMTLQVRNKAVTGMRNLRKETEDTGKAGKAAFGGMGKAIKATRSNAQSLLGTMVSLKTIIIATFAYRMIQRFGKFLDSLSENTNKQVTAVTALNEGLASFNNFTKESRDALVAQAGALQETHAVADDLIITNQALLATYDMEAKKIQEVTPLVLEFARAKQLDLKTAFDLVGKASVGYTGTLSIYGIILDSTLSKEEKYATFLKLLVQYKGTASAYAETYAGKIDRLKAAYGDMKEPMGSIIQDIFLQSGALDSLSGIISTVKAWMEKWKPTIVSLGKDSLTKLIEKIKETHEGLVEIATNNVTLAFFITLKSAASIATSGVGIFWATMKTGAAEMSDRLVTTLLRLQALYHWIEGNKELSVDLFLESVSHQKGIAKRSEDRFGELTRKINENNKDIIDSFKDVAKAWKEVWDDPEGKSIFDEWLKQMNAQNDALTANTKNREDNTRNRERGNDVIARTIELTRQEAQQYALATRLEQEQVKYMMDKLGGMSYEEVGGLSDVEKKLISRFKILQKIGEDVFGEYSSFQTGIPSEHLKDEKTLIQIDLSDEAKKLVRTSILNRQVQKDLRKQKASLAAAG